MSENSYRYIRFNKGWYLSDDAFNYNLKKENIDKSLFSIFEHYDENNDEVLDSNELQNLKKDLKDVNNDDKPNVLSKKEAKNLLIKIFPDVKIDNKILNSFLMELRFNHIDNIENISDGKIDFTSQEDGGDCWLLSEVRALSQTEWGAKAIKESIEYNQADKNYTVHLKGVNFSCLITNDEIIEAKKDKNKPSGDIDMLLLELATEKYFKQEISAGRMYKDTKDVLDGGLSIGEESMQYLLTGKKGHIFYIHSKHQSEEEKAKINESIKNNCRQAKYYKNNKENISNIYDRESKFELLKRLAKKIKNYAVTCTFKKAEKWENNEKYKRSEKKKDFNNTDLHVFVVENIIIDNEGNIREIILNNPWNSIVRIHKSPDEFIDQLSDISVTDEHENYDDLTEIAEPCWLD